MRQHEWGEEIDEAKLRGMTSRLAGAAWFTVALTIATIFVAMQR